MFQVCIWNHGAEAFGLACFEGSKRWREPPAMGRTLPTLRRAWPRDGPLAAICVQNVDVQCVLQFTLIHAAGCVLHRRTSRVIHRLKLFFWFSSLFESSRPTVAGHATEATVCARVAAVGRLFRFSPKVCFGQRKQKSGKNSQGAAPPFKTRGSL
jgi:hypothetical protein